MSNFDLTSLLLAAALGWSASTGPATRAAEANLVPLLAGVAWRDVQLVLVCGDGDRLRPECLGTGPGPVGALHAMTAP